MADSEEFRTLLAEAVHRIRRCEAGKPIGVIQDELGHALGKPGAGTAIAYWRKGHLPQVQDLEKLATEIIRRSDLPREWLHRFLAAADYPYVENLCNQLFPVTRPTPMLVTDTLATDLLPPTQAPFAKAYRTLMGRDSLVNEILAVLSDPDARTVVAIDGIGGIGKTALVQEVVVACQKQQLFRSVVWVSGARANQLDGASEPALTFNAILNAIGNQLHLPELLQLSDAEKESRVHALLRRQRVLIVLDNLETAAEAQAEIGKRLQPLLGESRAIFTSRWRFDGDFYTIHLEGLDAAAATQFLRQEANDRRIAVIERAEPTELAQIAHVTGASPLAMKLVVGQLAFLPLDVTLTHLQSVKPLIPQRDNDEYLGLYQYIYFPSWGLLSDPSKDLLVAMAHFAPGVGGRFAAVQAISGLTEAALPGYIRELWQLSLLEVGEASQGSLGEKRYHLHALTKHFVLSDVIYPGDAEKS
jgi:LuxR family glucitol operon transcriptional activator